MALTTTLVISGPSGAGKTTVARLLAERLAWPMLEGDDLHPPANVAAMRSARPLTDAERQPWLAAVAAWVGDQEAAGSDAVVTCSALTRAYRAVLTATHPSVVFVQLEVDPRTLAARIETRPSHFMPVSLLDSQLDLLEPLGPDERGLVVDADAPATQVVDRIVDELGLTGRA